MGARGERWGGGFRLLGESRPAPLGPQAHKSPRGSTAQRGASAPSARSASNASRHCPVFSISSTQSLRVLQQ